MDGSGDETGAPGSGPTLLVAISGVLSEARPDAATHPQAPPECSCNKDDRNSWPREYAYTCVIVRVFSHLVQSEGRSASGVCLCARAEVAHGP